MQMLINGQHVDASDGQVIEVTNPATGKVIDTVPSATTADIDKAIDAAEKGKEEWGNTPLHIRCGVIRKFAELIHEKRDEIAALMSADSGKSLKDCAGEFARVDNMIRGYAERANHLYNTWYPDCQPGMENDITLTKRVPLGIIVCIVPFNYPASLYCQKVVPALVMGNAVIIKPPTDCPTSVIRITELLFEAGLPGSAAQLVTGRGSVIGDYLCDNERIDAVTLTGSPSSGVSVAKQCAKYLHECYLELGGNDSLIVFDDADIDAAVEAAAISRSMNAGQSCGATKRFIVQNKVKDEFAKKLVERLKKVKVGDPSDENTDVGTVISERAAAEIEEQVAKTVKAGAKCVLGGKRDGAFFPMTVLTDVTENMDIASDMEVFGPVFPIIGFETEEDAIRINNNTVFGLNAAIMRDDFRASVRMAEKLTVGHVAIDGHANYRPPEIPWGGPGMSGLGNEGISATLEELSRRKTYTFRDIRK